MLVSPEKGPTKTWAAGPRGVRLLRSASACSARWCRSPPCRRRCDSSRRPSSTIYCGRAGEDGRSARWSQVGVVAAPKCLFSMDAYVPLLQAIHHVQIGRQGNKKGCTYLACSLGVNQAMLICIACDRPWAAAARLPARVRRRWQAGRQGATGDRTWKSPRD
jgi:hypothetical protein